MCHRDGGGRGSRTRRGSGGEGGGAKMERQPEPGGSGKTTSVRRRGERQGKGEKGHTVSPLRHVRLDLTAEHESSRLCMFNPTCGDTNSNEVVFAANKKQSEKTGSTKKSFTLRTDVFDWLALTFLIVKCNANIILA